LPVPALQLTTGLSNEHVGKLKASKEDTVNNADKVVCAKYYVQQIMNLDEEGIRQAYFKARLQCCTLCMLVWVARCHCSCHSPGVHSKRI
jgi:hypothetical protein